ncbi:MAG: helicase-related protein [Rectinemataceae bacterium]|jgi:SNF2 family DNA or RNA helicase
MQNHFGQSIPDTYSLLIKDFRQRLGLTQQAFAAQIGASFATVNRWENGQSKPNRLYWEQLRELSTSVSGLPAVYDAQPEEVGDIPIDFTSDPAIVKSLIEGERLSFGYQSNSAFAVELSAIDPLPHQRIAVYDRMLKQDRLRFLLADDAGAGKTIMAGLYIREMLSRRRIDRILIVSPAGLLGNWQSELSKLFSLQFRIASGLDARIGNPFCGEGSDRLIVSVDSLCGECLFAALQSQEVIPYDLVIFDEAHKLAADRGADLRVRKTDRYRIAESLAGVRPRDPGWDLEWSAQHLLLLTATPHMGKEYPYFALWRLLEPEIISTPSALESLTPLWRKSHFIRRTKEEMVYLDGHPLYPKRISETFGYDLSGGNFGEKTLYEKTTDYLTYIYNQSRILNREAARLALSVFQRRLASSTYALKCSFERRIEKLNDIIEKFENDNYSAERLGRDQQTLMKQADVFESMTGDDEEGSDGNEENEKVEDVHLAGTAASSLIEVISERDFVVQLLTHAQRTIDEGHESKFSKLQELLSGERFINERFIIFTEYRDTLDYLEQRLEGLGFAGKIARIHGGMGWQERTKEVEHFRKDLANGGARFLLCTDAAGEGINLQFCWIMVNYDIPWNPARLEQRMGRIHRYGQKHDPVFIMNLVAPETREGRVLKVLLDKLEKIRSALRSDKVFDCIGRLFENRSLKQFMEMALMESADAAARMLDGQFSEAQVVALYERERMLFGTGGDVKIDLPRIREEMDREVYARLLPGYVRQYVERAAPQIDLRLLGDPDSEFGFLPTVAGALDPIIRTLEDDASVDPQGLRLSLLRSARPEVLWFHPGAPAFESFRKTFRNRYRATSLRGAVFIDPSCERPYILHFALLTLLRSSDDAAPEAGSPQDQVSQDEGVLETRLIGLRQYSLTEIELCAPEQLLLLLPGQGIPEQAQLLAVQSASAASAVRIFLNDNLGKALVAERRNALEATLDDRLALLRRGFDFEEAELASARAKHTDKARKGNLKAQEALESVKARQRQLAQRREQALEALRREPELLALRDPTILAHALVVPSSSPAEQERHDAEVEAIAMSIAHAFEESAGAVVYDVHTPPLARAAGLPDNPGFDLLSKRPGGARLGIEVKGRAGLGDIEISANEWAKACNLRNDYWLYVVFDCASSHPRQVRVQDPFGKLLAKAKGSMIIGAASVLEAGEEV